MGRYQALQNKIVSLEKAKQLVSIWQLKNYKVVFTNGCFDILHQGHVTYLAKTADTGNKLILALNTDASVKRQGKGDDRPINNQDARAKVLSALGFVDAVIFFDDDTPLDLIKVLQPDVLTKGADYDATEMDESSPKYIVGNKEIKTWNGEVKTIDLEDGFSTTNILSKIRHT